MVANAVVGEPEAAVAIHHQIVRCTQRAAVAFGVQVGDGAGPGVDALDPTADVPRRIEPPGQHLAVELGPGRGAAVVAHVDRTVGPDGGAVGTTGNLGHRGRRAVGADPGESFAEHLDHTTVPSGIAIGPSGKSRPPTISVYCVIGEACHIESPARSDAGGRVAPA